MIGSNKIWKTVFSVSFLLLLGVTGFPLSVHTSALQEDRNTLGQPPERRSNEQAVDVTAGSVAEARLRSRLLHEAFAGALQVMHRDFFREDQRLKLPSRSLEDVFAEMAETHQVQLGWLAVNTTAMSVDHRPETDFEKQAVKALAAGKDEFDSVQDDVFQFAGSIRLSASCVKCHVRNRTSNEERKAALVITMPLTKNQAP